jgi:hypothetical protein
MTSADAFHGGPSKLSLEAVRSANADHPEQRLFLCGPLAVDPRFQGRGVLTMLLASLNRDLGGRFDLAVAFVEDANKKSLAVHRHYGMTEIPGFWYEGREYHVFTYSPDLFATR